jgi:hypothetical protein
MRVIQKVNTASTRVLLANFAWDAFYHPLFNVDFGPSDFHLFTNLTQYLGGTRMRSIDVNNKVKDWVNTLVAYFCDAGTQKRHMV